MVSNFRTNTELEILHILLDSVLVSVSHWEPILLAIQLKIKEIVQLFRLIQTMAGIVMLESEPWLH